jgi:hypothetical protein
MADYFVKNGGNDALDGLSDGNAWETIAKVNSFSSSPGFAAGDTISFNKGDVWLLNSDAHLDTSSDGSSGSPITFQAYGTGNNPVLRGGDDSLGSTGDWTNIGSNRWTRSLATLPLIVVFISGSTRSQGIKETSQANVTTDNEWFHSGSTLTVYSTLNPASNFDELVTVDASTVTPLIDVKSRDWLTFKDLDVRYSDNTGIDFHFTACTNCVVQDCEVSHCWDLAIDIRANSSDITIQNCNLHDIGTWLSTGKPDHNGQATSLSAGAGSCTATGCTITLCSSSAFGFEVGASATGWTISNCTIAGLGGAALNAKHGTHSFTGCTVDGIVDGHPVETANAVDAEGPRVRGIGSVGAVTVEDCVIKRCRHCISLGGSSSSTQATLTSRRNIFQDAMRAGGSLMLMGSSSDFEISWVSEADIFHQTTITTSLEDFRGVIRINRGNDVTITNMTVIDERTTGDVAFQSEQGGSDDLANFTVKNSSFTSAAGIPFVYDQPTGTLDIDTIHVERDGTTIFVRELGASDYSETDVTDGTWNAAVSGVTGAHISGAALFDSTTQGAGTYMQPGPGSPLIGAGVTGVAPTNDNQNIPFGDPPNIGARSNKIRHKRTMLRQMMAV